MLACSNVTPLQKQFAREYLVDLNATQAAIRAGTKSTRANQAGHELLRVPEVAEFIKDALAKRAKRVDIKADEVVAILARTVRADPRKLVEHVRTCCRYCHGWEFEYQRTPREMRDDRAAWDRRDKPQPGDVFDEKGGLGWDPRRDPHPDCVECFGRGIASVRIADTRTLDDESAALYAGAKHTQHGVEILLRDQDKAREQLGRHLGMFKDKLEVTGKLTWEQVLGLVPKSEEGDGL